ncbi:elongator complex protein 6 [Ceratina calcarata]|uniref:Elongator complex protein 6 n=1 Tax=Ceratina calcarata TaxID=156304 RepID=A0AAJ7J178_9HYME|nr:elongator complex protein 6 [Ceratina calcarata]XP_026670439.1 elongator complex protein 6 [Ceratina calcarata]XP_026670440.1 elongator complex protein 6 [Ceratina calcarata]XP_026670441.1 elongator complex protein 6 [Ceratina calcarata]
MDSVCNTLGIDKVDMNGKLTLIEEQHNSNANFLLSSIIFNAVRKNYGICFVIFHNTFNHYHNVGMKFGYNLTSLKEKGKVTVIEPMKAIVLNMECTKEQPTSTIRDIFMTIKSECDKMKDCTSVLIIIDDISHFHNFGCDLKESMYYVRYLRSFLGHSPLFQLCIVAHTYKNELKACAPNIFVNGLKRMAHLLVKTEPLQTGYSSDASGNITINWRTNNVRIKYNWPETAKYMYKLSNRQVQIYAPGTSVLSA